MISTKRSVADVWPLKNKRIFTLVDPDPLLEAAAGGPSSSTIETITFLLSKKAKVILASSFGNLRGLPMNLTDKQRETALNAFAKEEGFGYTNYFASLDPKEKLRVLAKLPTAAPTSCNANRSTGKTTFFAEQSNDDKRRALEETFPREVFASASVVPLAKALTQLFPEVSVTVVPDPVHANGAVASMKPGSILFLENLKFYAAETSANVDERVSFGQVLASYSDVFVNDSFSTSWEVKASTTAVPRLLRHGAAGLLMERELTFFGRLLTHPARPTGVVLGGSRVEEKLRLLLALLTKVDTVLLAGEVALPFLAAKGYPCGKGFDNKATMTLNGNDSPIKLTDVAKLILEQAALSSVRIVLPVDHYLNGEVKPSKTPFLSQGPAVPSELFALDVGPATLQLFAQELRRCRTVFWTGTLGATSVEGFQLGTHMFAASLAAAGTFCIVGGLHTVRAVQNAGVAKSISHLCSGGVASIQILQALTLPGVDALTDATVALDDKQAATVHELLRQLPLFAGCSAHQVSLIAKKTLRRAHSAGDILLYEGDRVSAIFVVAKGSLSAAPTAAHGLSYAWRRVAKGQAVGVYECLSLHTSKETVQVAEHDTILYVLSSSALQEAMDETPELAGQLLENLAEPLRLITDKERRDSTSWEAPFAADVTSSRLPQPFLKAGASCACAADVFSDLIATVATHRLQLSYRPFRSSVGAPCILSQPQQGLLPRCLASVLRSALFHCFVRRFPQWVPFLNGPTAALAASWSASMAVVPLKLLSEGLPLMQWSRQDVYESIVSQSVLSVLPVIAHYLYYVWITRLELSQRQQATDLSRLTVAASSRVTASVIAFPVLASQWAVTSSEPVYLVRQWIRYLLKEVVGLIVQVVVRRQVGNKHSKK